MAQSMMDSSIERRQHVCRGVTALVLCWCSVDIIISFAIISVADSFADQLKARQLMRAINFRYYKLQYYWKCGRCIMVMHLSSSPSSPSLSITVVNHVLKASLSSNINYVPMPNPTVCCVAVRIRA